MLRSGYPGDRLNSRQLHLLSLLRKQLLYLLRSVSALRGWLKERAVEALAECVAILVRGSSVAVEDLESLESVGVSLPLELKGGLLKVSLLGFLNSREDVLGLLALGDSRVRVVH